MKNNFKEMDNDSLLKLKLDLAEKIDEALHNMIYSEELNSWLDELELVRKECGERGL